MKNIIAKIRAIDKDTLCRTILQFLAYVNQIIALIGQTTWASAAWYQWLSFGFTAAITIVTWWNNNDITAFARLGTKVLDALEDGKITEEEVKGLLEKESSEQK